jgi:prepilin-type N-terminal cleavage/methylation domain-containing protein
MSVLNIRGFSIVELVTAVALMGIVAAIALPSWMRLTPTYSLNNSVRQIQSELHSIKMRAAAEGVAFQMAYSQGATAYTIKRNAQTVTTKPIAEGTTITKDGVISFSPQGTAGANRVRVRNGSGLCKQVVVSATGRVRICAPLSCAEDC